MTENQSPEAVSCEERALTIPKFREPYDVEENRLCICKTGSGGEHRQELCNFVPILEAVYTYDDGADQKTVYRISGIDEHGALLKAVDVPADELGNMKWLNNAWPAYCVLNAIGSPEKHLQCAIKGSAVGAEHRYIFSHTGWQKIDGEYHFLLPGNSKYEVELFGKQKRYGMIEQFDLADTAYTTGLLSLDVIPHEVLLPGLAVVFLSPLNEFLRMAGHEPKFILTIIGHTGSMKSTVAALLLSYFGNFSSSDLPLSFRDTANSIEYNAFALKDVPTVMDDYHPCAPGEAERMKNTMQTVARAYGDRASRSRLSPNITLRPNKTPMGNAIVTAEFQPDITESGIARLFCVEMPAGAVNKKLLTDVQTAARKGALQRTMFGYLEWLKKSFLSSDEQIEKFVDALDQKFILLRSEWQEKMQKEKRIAHARLAENLACLSLGFTMLLRFLKSVGAIGEDESEKFSSEMDALLLSLAIRQTEAVTADKPTHIFIRKFISLVESRQVTLLPTSSIFDETVSNFVGYEDEKYYYLLLDPVHKAVVKLCADQHDTFAVSARSLAKALGDEQLIEVSADKKNTQTKRFGNRSVRVLTLKKEAANNIADLYC